MIFEIFTILEVLSNPVRSQVLTSLGSSKAAKYSDLLNACELDPYSESGKLGYHLQQLISLGLIVRDDSTYKLTERGRKASRLMKRVKDISKEIFTSPEKKVDGLKRGLQVREATYSDLDGLIELWKLSNPANGEPDYFIALNIAGKEGIRKEELLSEGSGLGRRVFVAELKGQYIGCCIVDLISLAQMKAFYLADLKPNTLPKELRLPMSNQEKDFHKKYWEAQSKMIALGSSMNQIETRYGVTGTWVIDGEPIKLTFTRKNYEEGGYVTEDIKQIFDEILQYKKNKEDILATRRKELETLSYGGPPKCMEIFNLVIHPGYSYEEVYEGILNYVEDKAKKSGLSYIVGNEDHPSRVKLMRNMGFSEVHQPEFKYKHAGKMDTYWQFKKL